MGLGIARLWLTGSGAPDLGSRSASAGAVGITRSAAPSASQIRMRLDLQWAARILLARGSTAPASRLGDDCQDGHAIVAGGNIAASSQPPVTQARSRPGAHTKRRQCLAIIYLPIELAGRRPADADAPTADAQASYRVAGMTGAVAAALALHRLEEFAVRLGVLHLVEQEFDRRELVHGVQELAQDPHLGELALVGDELFLARAGAVDVHRREDALFRDAPVEVNFAVAGAFEFLVDDVVHLGAGVDQRRGEDGQAAAFLDVARGAEEALGPLQGVRIHATRQHLARGGNHGVVGPREA